MKKVTREFITLRQPRCTWKMMVIGNVDRSKIYEGETDCYDNVMREIKGRPEIVVCSGWLVGPYNEQLDRTIIIPWWWNVEMIEGGGFRHYDITPHSDESIEFEYVVDRDVIEFIKDPMNTLSSSIPDPLEYSDGVFYSVDFSQEPAKRTALGDLSLSSIYYTQRRSIITLNNTLDTSKIMSFNIGATPPSGNITLDI